MGSLMRDRFTHYSSLSHNCSISTHSSTKKKLRLIPFCASHTEIWYVMPNYKTGKTGPLKSKHTKSFILRGGRITSNVVLFQESYYYGSHNSSCKQTRSFLSWNDIYGIFYWLQCHLPEVFEIFFHWNLSTIQAIANRRYFQVNFSFSDRMASESVF